MELWPVNFDFYYKIPDTSKQSGSQINFIYIPYVFYKIYLSLSSNAAVEDFNTSHFFNSALNIDTLTILAWLNN